MIIVVIIIAPSILISAWVVITVDYKIHNVMAHMVVMTTKLCIRNKCWFSSCFKSRYKYKFLPYISFEVNTWVYSSSKLFLNTVFQCFLERLLCEHFLREEKAVHQHLSCWTQSRTGSQYSDLNFLKSFDILIQNNCWNCVLSFAANPMALR